jgi:hypothetical protein
MHFALSGSSAIFPASSLFVERKPLEISRLQIPPLKFRLFLQKIGGVREIILHFCRRFLDLGIRICLRRWRLHRKNSPKKSCLKRQAVMKSGERDRRRPVFLSANLSAIAKQRRKPGGGGSATETDRTPSFALHCKPSESFIFGRISYHGFPDFTDGKPVASHPCNR